MLWNALLVKQERQNYQRYAIVLVEMGAKLTKRKAVVDSTLKKDEGNFLFLNAETGYGLEAA